MTVASADPATLLQIRVAYNQSESLSTRRTEPQSTSFSLSSHDSLADPRIPVLAVKIQQDSAQGSIYRHGSASVTSSNDVSIYRHRLASVMQSNEL